MYQGWIEYYCRANIDLASYRLAYIPSRPTPLKTGSQARWRLCGRISASGKWEATAEPNCTGSNQADVLGTWRIVPHEV